MKAIGLLGGMSWESTQVYYRLINQFTAERLGGLHSARLWLHSVDFFEIERLQQRGDWATAGEMLAAAAQGLERAGADFIVLCTNTMHIVAAQIQQACSIPLLHIADATAEQIRRRGIATVGLLGTRFTMEKDFYGGRLREQHGVDVIVPPREARDEVHRVIYEELCLGRIVTSSRERYTQVIDELIGRGAQGIIFGCTEISLLVSEGASRVPVFDTTRIHAEIAVDRALAAA
ncbi:MAG TPA: aspartate/glutamate racemase family protein [Steroidobacter sp.]|jgi:aspartate racemase|nr:aspartate/glutamate racemase family protein [Steroidobacter sp.]